MRHQVRPAAFGFTPGLQPFEALLKCVPVIVLLLSVFPALAETPVQPVTVAVRAGEGNAELAPRFLGLSYESSMLLPKDGRYYFNPADQALVNTFKTLGITSLRVGANAVDDPSLPVPQEKDIDALFQFARVAGVKVIYSFRLKHGNPADSARLASYIATHYAKDLDCFAIGNEPNLYRPKPTYEEVFKLWKPHYDAILQAVPEANFAGLSATGPFALNLARDLAAGGHLAMATDHYYFLKSGRAGETNPPLTRMRFLSNKLHQDYEAAYANVGGVLAKEHVAYRIDEMNSCYNGGAKDSSDTFAATLWALDCTHWWAAHNILGVNYHTGEIVGRDGIFGAPNYAAFLRNPTGQGFTMRPQGYAYLAFSQGAHGHPLAVKIQTAPVFDFNAYSYQDDDGSVYVTLINKSYDANAKAASVSLNLALNIGAGNWQRMDLIQMNNDVASKTGITLGGASVNQQGVWNGRWYPFDSIDASRPTVLVAPATATVLRFSPLKMAQGHNNP